LELRRIGNGVRKGLRVGDETTPASLFTMGGVAAKRCTVAHLNDFAQWWPGAGAIRPLVWPSKKPRLSEVSAHHSQGESFRVRGLRSVAFSDVAATATPAPGRCRGPRGFRSPDHVTWPDRQIPDGDIENREEQVAASRMVPVQRLRVRARWRSERRVHWRRCDDGHSRFLLPLKGQHLPFLSRNARVEVGRPVMEG